MTQPLVAASYDTSYDLQAMTSWYGSTPQPLLKVRNVGGVTVSRLQRVLTQSYDTSYEIRMLV